MKHQDHKLKGAFRKEVKIDKCKHYDSMVRGGKTPNERAREEFRRPPYAGLFCEPRTCAKKEEEE